MDSKLIEVRWHGRGGLGAVTSAELIARAAIAEGKYAQSFPSFGPERRGAPLQAFLRISDEFIRLRTNIYTPDVVVIIDPTLLRVPDVTSGLKVDGKIIINSKKTPGEIKSEFGYSWTLAVVDATTIARETIRVPITNTAMIGAFLRVVDVVKLDSLVEQLHGRFGSWAGGNVDALKRAYDEVAIME